MIDILYIENPKEKKLKNLYLNDYNYYYKNNIKMRYKMEKKYRNNLATKKEFEITHPVPKMLYSSSNVEYIKPDLLILIIPLLPSMASLNIIARRKVSSP